MQECSCVVKGRKVPTAWDLGISETFKQILYSSIYSLFIKLSEPTLRISGFLPRIEDNLVAKLERNGAVACVMLGCMQGFGEEHHGKDDQATMCAV